LADVAHPILAQHPAPQVRGKSATTRIIRVHCKSRIAGIAPPSISLDLPNQITLWDFKTLGAFLAASLPLSVIIFTIVAHVAHSAPISIFYPLGACSPKGSKIFHWENKYVSEDLGLLDS
jgi:hypothetical protein